MAPRVLPGRAFVVERLGAPARLRLPLREHAQARRAGRLTGLRRSLLRRHGTPPGSVAPALDLPLRRQDLAAARDILQLEGVAAVAQVPGPLRVLVVPGIEGGPQLERQLVAVLVEKTGEERVVPRPALRRAVAEVLQVLDSDEVHLALAVLPGSAPVGHDLLQRLVALGRACGKKRGAELRPGRRRIPGMLR